MAFDVLRGSDGVAGAFGARCAGVAGIRRLGEQLCVLGVPAEASAG
jgi:hypothetical protein